MAIYQPIETPAQKQDWINWLEQQKEFLDNLKQEEITREVLNTEEGDLHEFKNMVGNFLATLKGQVVIIN